ncbi:bifunctional pyr operon transcriptional regulator/uracil phosphoribosyltransferase PyrR [Agromyces tardus]|jgi:pyrimidine operon attenuation protein/uracil phosphoribosyltransferase|uniref:Bifunctional protein PyrR n=1 Tax=Agromyces tardus TaxID=2583849 RepID=A0A3M8A1L7_9MICO|nr:bifunctional pyr operon transcriptional regulator/uracil phosphoribosyltransferase PyrR [Agromyces tardus]RNB45113.1 bifunctional pyr operon transcriptional regulator/uracil phosphoribosyltransferase PyrR [Agromyces tardus]
MAVRTVLQQADIDRALTRIAHEILESNRGADGLVLLGIPTRGVVLAERLAASIGRIAASDVPAGALDVTMYRDDLGRNPVRAPRPTSLPAGGIDGATVVLVDDVLYSGRTIRAAFDALSDLGRARAVRLAVLVDRGHREFPIRADFVGKNLPSSTRERINVHLHEIDGDDAVTIDGGDADVASAADAAEAGRDA